MLRRLLLSLPLCLALLLAACAPAPVAPEGGISGAALDYSAGALGAVDLADAQPVRAPGAMVVSAQHLATQAGLEMLAAGGNAVDAAVATGYALAVVHPCCGNIGGGGFMTLHLASGEDLFLDFRERAPLAATETMFQDEDGNVVPGRSTDTWLAVGVPGTVKGLNAALARYGTLPLAQVMAPAIRLAREGYELQEGDVRILHTSTEKFARHPDAAAIFLNGGKPWQVGERLRQENLATSLERIAAAGADGFYAGPTAAALVAASRERGGILAPRDLDRYAVRWLEPLRCRYRGRDVVSAPPPSSGGVAICQVLQVLEGWPVGEWGYGSTEYTHHLVEAERRAFADRNTYLGDPDFVANPLGDLLDPAHIAALRADIHADRATPSSEIAGSLGEPEGEHTTHYSVVDAAGNAVAVTYTVNFLFGMGDVAGDTGILMNNEMDDFTAKPGVPNGFGLVQGARNRVEPGKRPLSSMSPTIVLDDGALSMVTGSPGGSTIISTTLGTIVNVIDFGMNMQQAVDAPRVHHQWLPDEIMVETGYLTPAVRAALEARGHAIRELPSWGAAEAIRRDPASGMLEGANDRRRPAGLAAGR